MISELEDRAVEITQSKEQKEKRMKNSEDSFKDLHDNIKQTNIHNLGIPEGEERDRKLI